MIIMLEFLANLGAEVGNSSACILWLAEEPVAPQSLIK